MSRLNKWYRSTESDWHTTSCGPVAAARCDEWHHTPGEVFKCDRHRYRCRYRFWRLRHDDGEGAATGLSADASGYWAVHDVLDVRRPKKRRGQQLEVLISWAAHE